VEKEKEKEKGRVLAELELAKKAADEANAKLQEVQETDKLPAGESEQASMHGQQEADDNAALRSTVEQLEKARYELADAIDAKNEALSQVDDAVRASEVKAQEVELLTAEVKRLKGLIDSKMDGKGKKTAERIQNLEAENSALKLKLEKAKAAEEKAVQLERMVNELKSDADDARKSGSKSEQLADEWQKKAELLEVRLEEADQSNILKGESLNSAMEELDSTSSLLRDRESEVTALRDKVRFLEDELAKLKSDIVVSDQRANAAEKEAADLWTEVEGLRLKLQTAEEKMEALSSDKNASSEIETLNEQKNQLADELESTKDELEKVKKAMEGLASALQEMSAESREAQEKYLLKQDEIEHAQAQVEELNLSLKNTKENYELMLDEANYEKVCLTKSVERLQAEVKSAHEEWQSKELSFVSSIKNSEEEIGAIRVQMDRTLEVVKEKENENTELQEKLQQLESQLVEANRIREEANAETIQWKEKVLDQENELQNIKQENDDLQAKESAASEKIKQLSTQLANAKDGMINGNTKEGDNEKGDTEDEDEPVVVVSKMWENSKFADYDSSKEKENDDGDSQVDLESNKGDAGLDSNGLHSAKENSGRASPTKQHQQHKKKPLLKRFSGLLKKKSEN
jgi:chromosome segregation ATPase